MGRRTSLRAESGDSKWPNDPHSTDTGDSGMIVDEDDCDGDMEMVLVDKYALDEDETDEDGVGERGRENRGGESASKRLSGLVGDMGSGGRPDHALSVFTSPASQETDLVFFIGCSQLPSICLPSASSLFSVWSSLCLFVLFSLPFAVLD